MVRDQSRENFILVCSNSNAACDELFERLMQILDYNEILRLYSISHDIKRVPSEFLNFSNWDSRTKSFTMPELNFLYSHRVLVCTLTVAGNLTRANCCPVFRPDHFNYVIIDECACAHETMTLLPIAGQ